MPDLSGNIPDHVFYGSVMSEFLRISRATLLYPDFLYKAKQLLTRMLNQNGDHSKLILQLKKAITRNNDIFSRYKKSASDILQDIER